MKKVPLRKCVVTNQQYPKKELVRIVKNKENEIAIDLTGKMNGRGAYLKLSLEVIEMAKKRRSLERQFEVDDLSAIYEQLKELL